MGFRQDIRNSLVGAVIDAGDYWRAVRSATGGDEGLRSFIVNEHAGMGVVAALVLTIAVAGLVVGPSSHRPENEYNDAAALLATAAMAGAFFVSLTTINGSFQMVAQTLKVHPARMLEWVKCFKGRMRYEFAGHMTAALYLLALGVLAFVYLVNGPVHFWVALGIAVVAMPLDFLNAMSIHGTLVQRFLLPEMQQLRGSGAGGGETGGEKGQGAASDGGKGQEVPAMVAGGRDLGVQRQSGDGGEAVGDGGKGRQAGGKGVGTSSGRVRLGAQVVPSDSPSY